jgi:hypothetical protein
VALARFLESDTPWLLSRSLRRISDEDRERGRAPTMLVPISIRM